MNEKPEDFAKEEFDEQEFKPNHSPPGSEKDDGGVRLKDFVAYMQSHDYVYLPAGDFWPAARVNAQVPPVSITNAKGKKKTISASAWLASNAAIEQMTWIPGLPQIIRDKLVSDGGWIDRPGVTVLNLYRPSQPLQGDPDKAEPWLDHINMIYPDEGAHIIKWLAHRVQRPQEKINHGLVLGGVPGIGKARRRASYTSPQRHEGCARALRSRLALLSRSVRSASTRAHWSRQSLGLSRR
jgi:hypothetical protein